MLSNVSINPPIRGSIVKTDAMTKEIEEYQSPYKGFNSSFPKT